ncbi:ABC transporter permease [Exiguobacterium alkaliphilum]|uniref:ABC transporter permease n=1 Tax=Exiguobacterium alkaliphilum TaxID=1428684 RepID=UPI001BAD9FA2|nr:ABC transporter permease subunit [Exiguobacterium alkaliphilum]QUE85425.1 ABC transporter permease subunit [Exiguobacterium alkaliphilum]
MRRTLLRDPVFLIVFTILMGLLLLSIGNTIFRDGQVDQFPNRYSDEGRLIGIPPLEPSKDQWLGTDRAGNDLFQMMIEGFKWTVGICATVALGRMALGLVVGIPLAFRGARLNRIFKMLLDGFLILPISLLAMMMLFSSLLFADSTMVPPLVDRVTLQLTVFVFLGLPAVTLYLITEIRQLLQQEFMIVAETLGGSVWHRTRRHLWPHLVPTLVIVFMQQFVQTLMLLIHISLFGVFFGGTVFLFEGVRPTLFEWSSMFGFYFTQFTATTWMTNHMFLVPALGLSLLVFLSNLLTSRLERAFRLRRQEAVLTEETMSQAEAAAASLADPFTLVHADGSFQKMNQKKADGITH